MCQVQLWAFQWTCKWQGYLFNEGKNRHNICMVFSKDISDWHLPRAQGRRHYYFLSSNSLGATKKPASVTQPGRGTSWALNQVFQCKSNSGLWIRLVINEINKFWMVTPDHLILHYSIFKMLLMANFKRESPIGVHLIHSVLNLQRLTSSYGKFTTPCWAVSRLRKLSVKHHSKIYGYFLTPEITTGNYFGIGFKPQ